MKVSTVENDQLMVLITPDPFSKLNLVLTVMLPDEDAPLVSLIIPIAALTHVMEDGNATPKTNS